MGEEIGEEMGEEMSDGKIVSEVGGMIKEHLIEVIKTITILEV